MDRMLICVGGKLSNGPNRRRLLSLTRQRRFGAPGGTNDFDVPLFPRDERRPPGNGFVNGKPGLYHKQCPSAEVSQGR